jgi:hypothetical protein
MTHTLLAPLACSLVLLACPIATAQEQPAEPASRLVPLGSAGLAHSQAQPVEPTPAPPDAAAVGGGLKRFFGDVAHDYREWFTLDTTRTLMVGTASALFLRPADEALTDRGFEEVGDALTVGDEYGNLAFQVPVALGWWAIGHAVSAANRARQGVRRCHDSVRRRPLT